jgi:hypothetical protein
MPRRRATVNSNNQADHTRGSPGFPHVIAGENSFFGKLREGAPVLPGGVFRWQSFRSFSLKACDIAFKCLTALRWFLPYCACYQMRLFELLLKRSLLLALCR